jgi:hypothetical protein
MIRTDGHLWPLKKNDVKETQSMSTPQPTSIRPPRLAEVETRINPYLPILEKQRRALREQGFPDVGRRVAALEALARAIGAHADEWVQARSPWSWAANPPV